MLIYIFSLWDGFLISLPFFIFYLKTPLHLKDKIYFH